VAAVQRDFERDWPPHYYPALWRCCDEDPEVVLRDWRTLLVQHVRRVLDQATMRLPLPANRRCRALTQSHSAFMGVLSKHSLLPTKPEPQERNA